MKSQWIPQSIEKRLPPRFFFFFWRSDGESVPFRGNNLVLKAIARETKVEGKIRKWIKRLGLLRGTGPHSLSRALYIVWETADALMHPMPSVEERLERRKPGEKRHCNEIPGKLFLIRSERRSGTGATDSAWLDQWVGDLPGVREKYSTRLFDKGGNELD